MKKKISILFLSLFFVLSTVFMFACSNRNGNEDYFGDYDFTNPPEIEKTYDVDEGVKLDGVFDEDFWSGDLSWWEAVADGSGCNNAVAKPMFEEKDPVNVKVTSHFTDKGAYFAAKIDDPVITVYRNTGEPYSTYQKTGFSLYLAPFGSTTIANNAFELIFAADGSSMLRKHYLGEYNNYPLTTIGCGINIRGEVDENGNGEGVEGYDMEIFVPWSALGLEGKQDYLYGLVALQRHLDASGNSQFSWENVSTDMNFGNPSTWAVYTKDGYFVAPDPTAKVIDGNKDDWADYAGEVKRVRTIENDVEGDRYLEYMITKEEDGLYVYSEALVNLWLTGENDWYRNTNIELNITTATEGNAQFYVAAEDKVTKNITGIIKREQKVVNDKTYNFVTAEAFVSNETLMLQGVDVEKDYFRVGFSFRNGKRQNTDEELDPAENEVVVPITLGANTHQPFIWYSYGCNPYGDKVGRLYVYEDGIGGISASDKVIDGNYDDWNDYKGVDAVAEGRANVTGGVTDTSSMGKGFVAQAIKGADGVYVYATVRHAQWKEIDLEGHMNSNLAVGFALTNTDYTGNNSTLEWLRGNEIFFTSVGSNYGGAVDYVINRSENVDDKGLYTTVIEGFIPYNVLFSGHINNSGSTNVSDIDWNTVFNSETGEIAEGYALRVGFQWRTREEQAYMQGRNLRNDWLTCIFESVPSQANAWKMFFLDDKGIHQSRVTGDSFLSIDWENEYSGETSKVVGTGASSDLDTQTKAILKSDGLYTHTVSKMKHFTQGIATSGDWWNFWYKNTSVEIRGVNANNQNVQLAYISTYVCSNTGDIFDIDYVYDVTFDGTYYYITLDTFIDNNYLCSKLGYSEVPESIVAGFAFGVNYDGAIDGLAKEDYVDFVNGTSGSSLWSGNIWNPTVATSENGLYNISAIGMTVQSVAGKTLIKESDVVADAEVTYTGSAVKPEISVTVNDVPLVEGVDYDIEYSAVNAGTARFVLSGKGNYYGIVARDYIILPKTLESSMIDAIADQYFEGNEVTPLPTVRYNGKVLVPDVDYNVSYENNGAVGTGKVIITAVAGSNFTGSAEASFTITDTAKPIENLDITVASPVYVVEGTQDIRTEVVVKDNGKVLVEEVDYSLEFMVEGSNGTVVITAVQGSAYTGSVTKTFVVDTLIVVEEGDTVLDMEEDTFTYSGSAINPEVTVIVKGETVSEEFYTLQYSNNVNAGTASILVTFSGKYSGTASGEFIINAKALDSETANVTVEDSGLIQTGKALTPDVTVKDGDKTLVYSTDYTLEYANNVYLADGQDYGEGSVTITFKGNYSGEVVKTFRFEKFGGAEYKTMHAEEDVLSTYSGEELSVYGATDPRGFAYKAELTEEGLYFAGVAKHNDVGVTGQGKWWNENNFEIRVGNSGEGARLYIIENDFSEFEIAVIRRYDKNKETDGYNYVTVVEAFISRDNLEALNVGFSSTNNNFTRVSAAFKANNGSEKIDTITDDDGWWYVLGYSPNYLGAYVGPNGIVVNEELLVDNYVSLDSGFTLDGVADEAEWTDYSGYTAFANGTSDSKGVSMSTKVVSGMRGLYVYSVAKHKVYLNTDKTNTANNSQLAFEFALTNSDQSQFVNGNLLFLSSVGVTHYAGDVIQYFNTSEKDAEGFYTTTIEAFISWRAVSAENAHFDYNTGVKDDWDLRVGIMWRTEGEKIKTYRSSGGDRNFFELGHTAWRGGLSEARRMYYIKDGELAHNITDPQSSVYTLDGDVREWLTDEAIIDWTFNSKSYEGETRNIKYYGRLEEDGLYLAMLAKSKNYSLYDKAGFGENAGIELLVEKSDKSRGTIAKLMLDGSADVNTFIDTIHVGKISEQGEDGFYTLSSETFIPKYVLENFYGGNYGDSLRIAMVFCADYDHEQMKDSGNSAWQWVKGNPWAGTWELSYYYVSDFGFTSENPDGKEYIVPSAVSDVESVSFKGSNITPDVTVTLNEVVLNEGVDYDIVFSSNTNVGTASYTVTGKGDYFGSVTKTFEITAVDISGIVGDMVIEPQVFTGTQIMPSAELFLGDYVLTDNDVDITYGDNLNVGKGSVVVTGKGNFTGSAVLEFDITAKDISEGIVALVPGTVPGVQPSGEKLTYGDVVLVNGTDYDAVYSDYGSEGEGSATFTGKGNYTGSLTVSFTVSSPVILDDMSTSVSATPFEYYEPDAEQFLPSSVEVNYLITGALLVEGVDYSLGEVVYDNTDGGVATLEVIGKGVYSGVLTVTYTVNHYRYFAGKNSSALSVDVAEGPFTYTGEAITPAVTVMWNDEKLTEGEDYVLEISDNVSAGKAKITVTALAERYKSAYDTSFTIDPADLSTVSASVAVAEDLKFTGIAVTPEPKVMIADAALVKDTDFTVSYKGDNVNLKSDKDSGSGDYLYNYGEATVVVTGKGNYTGSVSTAYKFYNPSNEKRLDTDYEDDWSDYDGNAAIIFGFENKHGAEIKAWWGEEGLYFYTVARHYLTLDSDPAIYMNSSFSVETAVVSSDKNTVVQGATYHFAKNGVSNTATVRAYLTTGTEGNYVTYVEAFIPNDALIVESFKPYFTDNHLNDGYDLRFGVAWRTKGDDAPVFGTERGTQVKYSEYWQPLYRHGYYGESIAKNEYFYVDKNDAEINRGLRWSQYVAADRAIDGDVSDWADYDAAAGSGAVNVMTTEIGDGRYAKYRGYFGDDGLYVSVETKIDNFVAGNYKKDSAWVQDYVNGWHKDTGMELHIKTSSGSGTKDFPFNVTYGFNTTLAAHSSGKTLDGRFSLMESAMTYKKDTDGKYYVVVEAFVPNEILYAISGQDGVKPHVYNWIFGTNNDASTDAVTTTEIFKFVEGGSGEVGANASSWVEKWIGGAYSSNNITTWSATAA